MAHDVCADWVDEKSGLRCVALRALGSGHLCGYVGVTPAHPLHGVGYSEYHPSCDALWEKAKEGPIGDRGIIPVFCMADRDRPGLDVVFNVHGSITYSDGCEKYPAESDGLWWFGFDCAHSGDTPAKCNLDFVKSECAKLASQLHEVVAYAEEVDHA